MNVCENVFLVESWCSRFGMWKVMLKVLVYIEVLKVWVISVL